MTTILNQKGQKLLINLAGGRNLELLANSTAKVSETDLASEHLKCLITAGDITIISDPALENKDSVPGKFKHGKTEPVQLETKPHTAKTESTPVSDMGSLNAKPAETGKIGKTAEPKAEKTETGPSTNLPNAEKMDVRNTEKDEKKEVEKAVKTADSKRPTN